MVVPASNGSPTATAITHATPRACLPELQQRQQQHRQWQRQRTSLHVTAPHAHARQLARRSYQGLHGVYAQTVLPIQHPSPVLSAFGAFFAQCKHCITPPGGRPPNIYPQINSRLKHTWTSLGALARSILLYIGTGGRFPTAQHGTARLRARAQLWLEVVELTRPADTATPASISQVCLGSNQGSVVSPLTVCRRHCQAAGCMHAPAAGGSSSDSSSCTAPHCTTLHRTGPRPLHLFGLPAPLPTVLGAATLGT